MTNPTTMQTPPPPPRKKASRKNLIILGILAVGIICWGITAYVFGPGLREKEAAKFYEKLQKDSVALAEFSSIPAYNHPGDIVNAVKEVLEYREPGRYGDLHDSLDSARYLSNHSIASIIDHNVKTCDSIILSEGAKWRRLYVLAQNKSKNSKNIIYRVSGDDTNVIEVYSTDFFQKDGHKAAKNGIIDETKVQEFYMDIHRDLQILGFKQVQFAIAPDQESISYDL